MSIFYAELRRQEALERIALKNGLSSPLPDPIALPIRRKREPQKPHQQNTKVCEICKEEFRVRPSHASRYRTCTKPECRERMRALCQRKHPLWANPKVCEYPSCPNTLEPRHKKYCSRNCAMRDRHRRS